jgi:hypothetical protein
METPEEREFNIADMPEFSDEWVENVFSYHAPKYDQGERYAELRAAGLNLAKKLREEVPPSFELLVALRKLREVIMWANAGIACNE